MGKTIFFKNPIIPKPEVEIWRTEGWPVGALQYYPPTKFGGPSPPASTFFWRSKLQKFSQKSPQRQLTHIYINEEKEDSRSRMLRLWTPLTIVCWTELLSVDTRLLSEILCTTDCVVLASVLVLYDSLAVFCDKVLSTAVLQSLMVAQVLSLLDCCNSLLAGIPASLICQHLVGSECSSMAREGQLSDDMLSAHVIDAFIGASLLSVNVALWILIKLLLSTVNIHSEP